MVDDNINDDVDEKSLVVSDQEKRSRNKRKFASKLPLGTPSDSLVPSLMEFPRYELLEKATKGGTLFEIDPLTSGCPQSDAEQKVETPPNIDWEDTTTTQLLELLTQNLSTIFQSAVKRIAKCGYSEEIAERVILKSGLYHGSKDVVSNVVDGALALLSREKVLDIGRPVIFADLPSLVDYTLLEMVCVLREVKPALPVVEAMWWLLILDLNLVHACTMEGYHLVELCSQENPSDSSFGLNLSQSKTEASENTQSNPDKQQLSKPFTSIAQTLQSKVLVTSAALEELESINSHVCQAAKGKGSSTPFPKAEAKLKATILEDKSEAGQKALNSKKDLHRRKTYRFEKNCRSTGKNIKANMTAWGSLVLDKKLNSSSSGATKKSSHSKVKISVKCNQPLAKASSDSPCLSSSIAPASDTSKVPPMQDNTNEKDLDSLAMEPKSSKKVPDNIIVSSAVPDYYAGIPYDESLGKYVPQNERDETILLRTSRLKTLQKELQGWSDWANEKVMQATRRLGKNQAELKMMRQEKEDAEKVHQEKQMLEETTMERIMEMEQTLVNTNSMGETINSLLNTLEMDNVGLKKDMKVVMLSTGEHAMNVNNALANEKDAIKKCQAADMEKRSFEEDLSTIKQEKTSLQQQQEKANKVVDQFKVLLKQEEWVKQRFLQQADSLKAEREQLRVQGKVQRHNFREKVDRNMQKYKEEIQKCESEISQLRFQYEKSKIEALKQGIPQLTKGLAAYAESSDSNVVKMERECVMCMNEQISVVFLPCAHQVLCEDCNVLHQKKGMDECPSCRTPIKERISVHFPDSE
ncbi:putative E3 ubiquitin-protein ligase RF298 [Solanum tuberosum]|nr:PREDICTED: putative E3 ubiquitin-protein ligase RF298 [Solanum tuberosum]KAH0633937.1 hypothetical protein KY284_036723 [Solanum tuberosum]KAH0636981.1 hypothetical protein KY289_036896 [Solanum tuberosum]